ncbi:MAG: retropepsin-like aspartic protease [Flavobacterium sp.]|uniref:Clan AA aspartic protease n=1 Tax=Flavobacterium celericrescens TaxID=2709780 RepID=A0ABX0I7Y7_9FLAO|nr:retropepsin-like aspartic protease [Flavobacterium celericrescens]NHM03247.1 clan AA aspartic protease [Flavobacterium celericrescens]
MEDLQDFLKEKKYKKVKFKVLKTQHLLITAKINGIKGNFILDTGASNSCVGFESIERFFLNAQFSETKAAGAGAVGMETQLAKNNEIRLGSWKNNRFHLIVFDMSHVNEALLQYKTKPVDGIIGADVLLKGKAIIDYSNSCLYLK